PPATAMPRPARRAAATPARWPAWPSACSCWWRSSGAASGSATSSAEEPVADPDGRDHPGQFGEQRAADGVAGALDADRAEVHRQYVEGGLGTALDGRR